MNKRESEKAKRLLLAWVAARWPRYVKARIAPLGFTGGEVQGLTPDNGGIMANEWHHIGYVDDLVRSFEEEIA